MNIFWIELKIIEEIVEIWIKKKYLYIDLKYLQYMYCPICSTRFFNQNYYF